MTSIACLYVLIALPYAFINSCACAIPSSNATLFALFFSESAFKVSDCFNVLSVSHQEVAHVLIWCGIVFFKTHRHIKVQGSLLQIVRVVQVSPTEVVMETTVAWFFQQQARASTSSPAPACCCRSIVQLHSGIFPSIGST